MKNSKLTTEHYIYVPNSNKYYKPIEYQYYEFGNYYSDTSANPNSNEYIGSSYIGSFSDYKGEWVIIRLPHEILLTKSKSPTLSNFCLKACFLRQ